MTEQKQSKQTQPKESPEALQAFEDYYALGAGRSLDKLVAQYRSQTGNRPTVRKATLAEWSSSFEWQERIKLRIQEETQVVRKSEIAKVIETRRRRSDARLTASQALQNAATLIIGKAELGKLDVKEARYLLSTAVKFMEAGMKAERLELGALSVSIAHERMTARTPGRESAFVVLNLPTTIKEISHKAASFRGKSLPWPAGLRALDR